MVINIDLDLCPEPITDKVKAFVKRQIKKTTFHKKDDNYVQVIWNPIIYKIELSIYASDDFLLYFKTFEPKDI